MTTKDSKLRKELVHYDYHAAILDLQNYIRKGWEIVRAYGDGSIFYTTISCEPEVGWVSEEKQSTLDWDNPPKTQKELEALSWDDLKEYGKSLGVTDRSRTKLVKKILEAVS